MVIQKEAIECYGVGIILRIKVVFRMRSCALLDYQAGLPCRGISYILSRLSLLYRPFSAEGTRE